MSAIDSAAMVVYIEQKTCKDWKIAWSLWIDVKRDFDHVFRADLAQKIANLGIVDGFLGGQICFC